MYLLLQDIKYASRRLHRTPVFSVFAIVILAIGIGLNVAVFGIVDALLWRAAPYADPERIVHIYQDSDSGEPAATAYPAYLDVAAMSDTFAGVSATRSTTATWETPGGPREVAVDFATSSYLAVLGLSVSHGRWFGSEHDDVGAELVAVLTERAWRTRFGADPAVLGTTIRLNNQPVTIVGIGPRGFNGEAGAISGDFWLSISSVGIDGPFAIANLDRRQDHWFSVKARLAEGVTIERARTELAALAARHGELYPDIDRGRDITAFALDEVRIHPQIDAVMTGGGIGLFVVAGIVLLLACGNLANLLLVRGLERGPELAIREALGGDRGRVGRPLLLEALLLAALGGALALVAAFWLQELLATVRLPPANQALDVRFDYRIVLFSMLASLGTGALFGMLPARRSANADVASALRDAGRAHSSRRGTSLLRGTLVVAQVALSVVLVTTTALLARSFINAERVDPGVDTARIAVLGTNLLQAGVPVAETELVAAEMLERIGALPGITSAALTTRLPLSAGFSASTIVEGYELARGTNALEIQVASVSPNYFATMGIRLLEGRDFAATDNRDAAPVIIVNETAARLFFGGNALGRRVRPQDDPDGWREVIAVVADSKVSDLQEPPTPLMYTAARQTGAGAFSIVVRTDGDPAALLSALPRALGDVRPGLPVTRLEAFEAQLAAALTAARLTALLMGAFAGLALLLATLGIYAAVSFSVERRAEEIGLRAALGATASQLIRMVVTGSLRLAGLGLVAGLGLAVVAAHGMRTILFGVEPFDAVSFLVAAVLLLGATALAAVIPARRASLTSPSDVLRNS